MRKVKFNKHVKRDHPSGSYYSWVLQKDYPNEGLFHQWGSESNDGGPDTVAIIEIPDGTIESISPSQIKFIHTP